MLSHLRRPAAISRFLPLPRAVPPTLSVAQGDRPGDSTSAKTTFASCQPDYSLSTQQPSAVTRPFSTAAAPQGDSSEECDLVSSRSRTGLLGLPDLDRAVFDVDWSFISPAGLGHVFHELLADLVGVPPPPSPFASELQHWKTRGRWAAANVEEIYSQQRLRSAGSTGYLVRGVIYDVSALMARETDVRREAASERKRESEGPAAAEEDEVARKLERAELAKRDWESFVLGDGPAPEQEGGAESASADMVKVGMTVDEMAGQLAQDVPAEGNRTQALGRSRGGGRGAGARPPPTPPTSNRILPPQSKERALEEAMGRGDSVRAKYMAKMMEKKMMAESRRESGRFAVGQGGRKGGSGEADLGRLAKEKGWTAMPGSPGLLRHFRERGLVQALLVGLPPGDRTYLEDQLGGFSFDPSTPVGPEQPISRPLLESICGRWGLQPKQVMLVVGTGKMSGDILRSVKDAGFFVSQMTSGFSLDPHAPSANRTPLSLATAASSEADRAPNGPITGQAVHPQAVATGPVRPGTPGMHGPDCSDLSEGGSGLEGSARMKKLVANKGLLGWYSKLAEGTLHVEAKPALGPKRQGEVHFRLSDMRELKWVIEDLNGVSYRKSTFVRSQDKGSQSTAIVMRSPQAAVGA